MVSTLAIVMSTPCFKDTSCSSSALKISRQATELRELASQKEAITANLKLLQAQIEPHFLFNTLANLHSLIGQNDAFPVAGKVVVILDPTEILARKCVSLCQPAA